MGRVNRRPASVNYACQRRGSMDLQKPGLTSAAAEALRRPSTLCSRMMRDERLGARCLGLSKDRRERNAGVFHGLLHDRRRFAVEQLT